MLAFMIKTKNVIASILCGHHNCSPQGMKTRQEMTPIRGVCAPGIFKGIIHSWPPGGSRITFTLTTIARDKTIKGGPKACSSVQKSKTQGQTKTFHSIT